MASSSVTPSSTDTCSVLWLPPYPVPTRIRATAGGFATSMTRIGAAVVGSGLLMCILWAPETSGRYLDDISGEPND